MMFRDLTADEIDCRVQSVKPNGLILLLYKDARCDMNILDETVGSENWQREHYECKGNLFCRVGIHTENGWIWKSDCGVESNTEAQKGESSDSFKRACFCWGLGRELYTAPFTWIPADKANIANGKCFDRFSVKSITIVNKKIVQLTIFNESKNTVCFDWKSGAVQKPAEPIEEPVKASPSRRDTVEKLIAGKGFTLETCNQWLRSKMEDPLVTWETAPSEWYIQMCEALKKVGAR